MPSLISQIIVTLLTAFISQIALNKDSRSRTNILKRETVVIRWVIAFITVVSIVNSVVSFINSTNDNKQLVRDNKNLIDTLSALRKDNGHLRQTLNKNSIVQSNLITSSQLKSASELKIAANDLHDLINGSDSVLKFHFALVNAIINKEIIKGSLFKDDRKPVYNSKISIINMDSLLNCKIGIVGKLKVLDLNCINNNSTDLGLVPVVEDKQDYVVDLPKYNSKAKRGKFLISITFKGKIYQEEAIYSLEKNELLQSTRIIELKDDKIIKTWVVKRKEFELKNIDWKKEFPDYYVHFVHMINFD